MPLPRILAGPILRRVQTDSVSVWVATSEPGRVQVRLYRGPTDGSDSARAHFSQGLKTSVQVGPQLFVNTVTVDLDGPDVLTSGQTYSYDVLLSPQPNQFESLHDLGLLTAGERSGHEHLPLGYVPNALPSFSLPPGNLEDLKVLHASCRKLHGPGRDALAFADDLINDNHTEPNHRPHLLVLTGDQIYADDVALPFLGSITQLGEELFTGKPESLRVSKDPETWLEANLANFPPGFRQLLVEHCAKFTSSDASSHIMSLAEYAALYLLSWNIELWPSKPDELPLFGDVLLDLPGTPAVDGPAAAFLFSAIKGEASTGVARKYWQHFFELGLAADGETAKLLEVMKHLKPSWLEPDNVQKKLDANENPDLTETLQWATALFSDEANPENDERKHICDFYSELCSTFGDLQAHAKEQRDHLLETYRTLPKIRRVLANVPTYMIWDDHDVTDDWNLTQHWITSVNNSACGSAIVRNAMTAYALFQDWGNQPDTYDMDGQKKPLLDAIEALYADAASPDRWPVAAGADALQALYDQEDDEALQWHYGFDGVDFKVLVLNTRTERSFDSRFAAPNLIPLIAGGGPLGRQIPPTPQAGPGGVLLVVSPVPVLGLPVIEQLAQTVGTRLIDFGLVVSGRDRSASTILDAEAWALHRVGFEDLLARLAANRRIVFLSGDVHYGAAGQLTYWRAGDDQLTRFAQFTASPAKNAWPEPIVMGVDAFAFAQRVLTVQGTSQRMGWQSSDPPPIVFAADQDVPVDLALLTEFDPVLIPVFEHRPWAGATSSREADFRWRMELLRDERPEDERPDSVSPKPLASGDLDTADPLVAYREAISRHADFVQKRAFTRSTLWRNNLGVIRFEDQTGEFEAVQELWAVNPDELITQPAAVMSEYRTSLQPGEPPDPPSLPGDGDG